MPNGSLFFCLMKLVVASDTHLNCYYARMSPAQLEQRRWRIRQAFSQTIDYCIRQNARAYLHAGDLFDMPDPRISELTFAVKQFVRLREAGIPAAGIAGGHDLPRTTAFGTPPQQMLDEAGLFKFLPAQTATDFEAVSPIVLESSDAKVAVWGISWNHKPEVCEEVLRNLSLPKTDGVNILLLHAGIEGYMPIGSADSIVTLDALRSAKGVDVFVIGHQHRWAVFPLDGKLVIIPGSTERFDFGEAENEAGFWCIDIQGREVEAHYVRIEPQPMKTLNISAEELANEDPTEALAAQVAQSSAEDQLLKLSVTGTISREAFHRIRWADIYREGSAKNFYFVLDNYGLQVIGEKLSIQGTPISVLEEIELAAKVLEDASQNPEEKATVTDAKNLLLNRYTR